jgi:periplasmic divalent cation tolerance protein
VTDLASTVALGLVDLTLGRTAGALASARYLAGLWAVQPHTDVVLLRRDARGGLLGVDAVEPRAGHALHVEGGCQGHGVLGAAVSFLLVLGETDPAGAPGGVEVQRLAGNILRFAARCVGNVTDPADAAELCSAAAVFGHATGDRDALDLSARLLRGLTHQQDVDGLFRQHLDSASERAERTARVAAALSEAALGAAPEGPREVPDGAPDGVRVVLCNAPGDKVQALADALLSERLAACVNVIPVVESAYEWKGRFEREPEATMLIKTTRGRVAALTARLRALHPYELPEVLSLAAEPSEGNADYAAWVRGQVRPRQG